MNKVSIITLGCKVNQVESEMIAEKLEEFSYDVSMGLNNSDIFVINTCAVTNEAERKSRNIVAKILKINPNPKIYVCGCSAENNPENFTQKGEIIKKVIGTKNKIQLADIIKNDNPIKLNNNITDIKRVTDRTRAVLWVQNGCNNFCTYCIIPYLRGREVSFPINEIKSEVNKLCKVSKEIVIAGINLSAYGKDIKGSDGLIEIARLFKNKENRFRFSSLEVNVITDDFMHFLIRTPNFCPQFHLSLQSGSNSVLKRMNRHYTTDEYLQKIELIKKYYPNANITTDVIVGFAGETDEEFEETLNTVKKAGFGNMHIFPYSKRAGTKAYGLKTPSGVVVKQRLKKLNDLKNELMLNYFNSIKNQTFNMLIEETEENYYVGYTENYVKAYLSLNAPVKPNQIVKVKLTEPFKNGMKAELVLE